MNNIKLCSAAAFLVVLIPSLHAQGITKQAIGSPDWEPVGFSMFAAPVGTPESGYVEFGQTLAALLPAPNHVPHPNLGIGPGAPHSGPYADEIREGIAANGFREATVFLGSEFSGGTGVYLTWMNVPTGAFTGSSPDSANGPIIPNSLFPLQVDGDVYLGSTLFDPFFDFQVPPLDSALNPPFAVDGHSHFPLFLAESKDANISGNRSLLYGDYRYEISLIDQSGAGWRITAPFQVVPEASTIWVGTSFTLALVSAVIRRRSPTT